MIFYIIFSMMFLVFFPFKGPPRGLGSLKLDEIDAANSFLMLLMARNCLKWSFKNHFRQVKHQIFGGRPSASKIAKKCRNAT